MLIGGVVALARAVDSPEQPKLLACRGSAGFRAFVAAAAVRDALRAWSLVFIRLAALPEDVAAKLVARFDRLFPVSGTTTPDRCSIAIF